MKMTFVSPRYGKEIIGGAEYAIRLLAENCSKYSDVEVEVLSTVAGDERTWSPIYGSGLEVVNGINVRRFNNRSINREQFDTWSQPLLQNPELVGDGQFNEWLIKQGPYSADLIEEIRESSSDVLIFHPMLSSPASHGIIQAKKPTVLHPALHDEPLARMPGYGNVLRKSDLLAFSTRYEQDLSQKLHSTFTTRQSVIGFGIDKDAEVDLDTVNSVLTKYKIENSDYILVLGRVDPAKGADLSAQMFFQISKKIPKDVNLVFVGPLSDSSMLARMTKDELVSKRLVVTGPVNDLEKTVLLSNAKVLLSPSVTESFSLVLLEAMSCGVPVIVNQNCGPTLEHVQRSRSGASFFDLNSLAISLIEALTDSASREKSISNGISYVNQHYRWEALISRYLEAIGGVL